MSEFTDDKAKDLPPQSDEGQWTLIDMAMRRALQAEIKRTRATALILQHNVPNWPDGMTVSFVNRIIGGLIKRAPKEQIEQIFAMWAALPDAASGHALRPHRKRAPKALIGRPGYEPLAAEALDILRAHRRRTKIGPSVLLDDARGVPPGLTPAVIAGWLDGRTKTALPAHVVYVMTRYANWGLPDV